MNQQVKYRQAFKTYGESPKALKWSSYRSQATHLKYLIVDLDLANKSVLDAGCGMGDLLPFLYAKADNFDYLGVDLNPEFIQVAKKRFLGHDFEVLDPFQGKLDKTFDVVICSGALNSNVSKWLEKRKRMINNLFELADESLAFNMAGAKEKITDTNSIAYARTSDILNFCLTLTPKVKLRTGYHPKDFTVTMFK